MDPDPYCKCISADPDPGKLDRCVSVPYLDRPRTGTDFCCCRVWRTGDWKEEAQIKEPFEVRFCHTRYLRILWNYCFLLVSCSIKLPMFWCRVSANLIIKNVVIRPERYHTVASGEIQLEKNARYWDSFRTFFLFSVFCWIFLCNVLFQEQGKESPYPNSFWNGYLLCSLIGKVFV